MTQSELAALSGVGIRSIQLYEQRVKDNQERINRSCLQAREGSPHKHGIIDGKMKDQFSVIWNSYTRLELLSFVL